MTNFRIGSRPMSSGSETGDTTVVQTVKGGSIPTPALHIFESGNPVAHGKDEQKPATPQEKSAAKPFLKWVGGKRSILPELIARMPASYETYREPFVGGGALFFAVQPKKAALSDVNFRLMITYRAVRDNVAGLIEELKIHNEKHSKEHFYAMRELLGTEQDPTKIAALVIYLNKTCFNGLYRVNRRGMFNVPMGNYKNPCLYDDAVLKADSEALKGVQLQQCSFEQVKVAKGDFVYLDPPYHKTFSSYDSSRFDDKAHARLAEFCKQIDKAGAHFMLSNSDTDVRGLYSGFLIEDVQATRRVSCKAGSRSKETEIIVRNYA